MTTETITLTSFLLARLEDDEEAAREAAGWDRSGRERATGRWAHVGIASVNDDQGRMVIYSDSDQLSPSTAAHIARHDPARVLAECAVKRQLFGIHWTRGERMDWDHECDMSAEPSNGFWPCETVSLLLSVYSDHPEFREEWRP